MTVTGPAEAMVVVAVLVLLGVGASKVSARLGVPVLLLFLALGMLAGSDGIGGIEFSDHQLAQDVGVVALAFILFAGGFDTSWGEVRPVAGRGLLLATVGVAVTAGVAGLAATVVLDVSLTTGLLLGAIISSTDAAAVFAVLRSRGVGLRGRLRPLLELESGSNDPMAVFLTIALLGVLTGERSSAGALVLLFVGQALVGTAGGLAVGFGTAALLRRLRLEYEGLYPTVMIAVVLLAYGGVAALGGSGFLAVYLAGLVLGRERFLHRKSLMRFADGLAWLMQIAMFLVLGLLVFPSDLLDVALEALAISAVLILVARPIGTALVLLPTRLPPAETALVAWVGLRGAVPIVLATFPLVEGLPEADLLFDVVFFIVLSSVLVQGTTIPWVARRLGVDEPAGPTRPLMLDVVEAGDGSTDLVEVTMPPGPAVGQQILDLHLPEGALVVLVRRGDEFIVPQGATRLEVDDTILLAANEQHRAEALARLLGGDG